MKTKFWVLGATLCFLCSDFGAFAQSSTPVDTMGIVKKVADELGMARPVQPPGGTLRGVDGILFVASGTMTTPSLSGAWATAKITKLTTEVTYYQYSQGIATSPGIRCDFTLADASGKVHRDVLTAAGGFAWDQHDLDGPATPATNALDERLKEIWSTPHGLIWAALAPDGKRLASGVTVSKSGPHVVLLIPENGVAMKVTLDEQNRPARVEVPVTDPILGDTVLEAFYSGYRDFENAYGVFFPTTIVEKLAGRTIMNLTVSAFHTNPYIVFPIPANIRGRDAIVQ